jgi:hypothetical protein
MSKVVTAHYLLLLEGLSGLLTFINSCAKHSGAFPDYKTTSLSRGFHDRKCQDFDVKSYFTVDEEVIRSKVAPQRKSALSRFLVVLTPTLLRVKLASASTGCGRVPSP